ncbi:LacI family transcriptional regulator [bacterium]|nr:LacI family transcriptional regulator [bacterium]
MPRLTLEDIAKQAGVSRSTVSRVVNDHPNISDKVRSRVLKIINETGYRPNAAARALVSQRSQTIGLLLPHTISALFADPYFPHLIKGITKACNQLEYTLALFLASSAEDEKMITTRIQDRGLLDGVLIQSGHHGHLKIVDQLTAAGTPQVVIGRPFFPDRVSYVDIDNHGAAINAVTLLLEMGYQRIATITGPLKSTAGQARLEGYKEALKRANRLVDEKLIEVGDFTQPGGYRAMQALLSQQPDAVFAASDITAVGAIRAIQEAGLRVPEDIAIVGFDDIPLPTLTSVALTTVRQPVEGLGEAAVDLLMDLIENGVKPHRHTILGTELVVRTSSGKGQH